MIFNNLNVKNEYISFVNQNLDLSKKGVYIINGENGAGKSSIIKSIVFEQKKVKCKTQEQQEAYLKNKAGIISYVPQNVISPNISIYNYLKKHADVNIDKAKELGLQLGIEFDEKQKFSRLSGGEKEKLAIISAILKNTPYIIMDEPTNNLDDSSVISLCALIERISKEKTVIIICHDPRLIIDNANKIIVKDNCITQLSNKGEDNRESPIVFKNYSPYKCALKFQKNIFNITKHLFMICMLLVVLYFNHIEFMTYISETAFPEKGSVLQYCAEGVYPNINESYVKATKLDIDKSRYLSTLPYSCIPELSRKEYVNDIFLFNQDKFTNLLSGLSYQDGDKGDIDSKPSVMIPEFIYKNYRENMGVQYICHINEGRSPFDNKKEIAVNEETAKLMTGCNSTSDALMKNVIYKEQSYTIVGICDVDVLWVSNEDNASDSLFYRYSEESWNNYCEKIDLSYENESRSGAVIQYAVFTTTDEESLLNELLVNYPASDYYSNYYCDVTQNYHYTSFYKRILITDIIIVAFVCLLFVFIGRSSEYDELCTLIDYENYYIANNLFRKTYIITKLVARIISIVLIMLITVIVSHIYVINCLIILICSCLVALSEFINTYSVIRRLRKK